MRTLAAGAILLKDYGAAIAEIDVKIDAIKAKRDAEGAKAPKIVYWAVTIASWIGAAIFGEKYWAAKGAVGAFTKIVHRVRKSKGSAEDVVKDCANLGNEVIDSAAEKLPHL